MRTIRWLHISDIHMRQDDTWSQNNVLEAMCRAVEGQRTELPIDFVLVSGDLAFSGKAEEYSLVAKFFDALAAAAAVESERIFCIPGNHDIDRDRQHLCFRGARLELSDPNAADAFLASPFADDFQTLLQRQAAYRAFQGDYFARQDRTPTEDGLGYVSRLAVDGVHFAVLGLDSAWLAAGGMDDHLHLLLGERQVLNAIDLVRGGGDTPHIVAAMAHHPLHLLQDFDRRSVQVRLDGFCQFLHYGHLHFPETRPTGNTPLGCLNVAAGATFQARHAENSYSTITLDLLDGLRRVTVSRYNAVGGTFSTVATNDYPIEVMPARTCDIEELATAISARTEIRWPHYAAALLLGRKSEVPVPTANGHAMASYEVIEALPDGALKRACLAFRAFRNALRVLYGRETLDDIFMHHGDVVLDYCTMLTTLGASEPTLKARLDEQEHDALNFCDMRGATTFFHTRTFLRELAEAQDWDSLRAQAERHINADDPEFATDAKRMLALALANGPDAGDKAAAILLYREVAESAALNPTDTSNLAILLADTGATAEAKTVLLRGVAECSPGRLDSLVEAGHRLVAATGDKVFRDRLRAAIAERGAR